MTIIGRRRLLHTTVSSEIIKPSFPTPSHLKTYNLSVCDQFIPSTFIPMLTFYPTLNLFHSSHDQHMLQLKNSLSHTLTKYYPFAGRHDKIAPSFVDCNDGGAEFIEASIDSSVENFLQNSQLEDLDQLFPHNRTWNNSNDDIVIPLAVKVTCFEGGGVAVAVSLSHKIADAYSCIHFLSDWAEMARQALSKKKDPEPINEPHFISFGNKNMNFSGTSLERMSINDCVTKTFVFPNAKLNELKNKYRQQIINPTRVELITWLLYKCAVEAATSNNKGSFTPTHIRIAANIRDKMTEPLPEKSIGNFLGGFETQTTNISELKPEFLISELRNQKKKIYNLMNIDAFFAPLLSISCSDMSNILEQRQRKFENTYIFSSICGFNTQRIDFGWGTPIRFSTPGNLRKNSFIITDAPNGEGIEVLVCLAKQDMDIIQRDPELLSFSNVSLTLI